MIYSNHSIYEPMGHEDWGCATSESGYITIKASALDAAYGALSLKIDLSQYTINGFYYGVFNVSFWTDNSRYNGTGVWTLTVYIVNDTGRIRAR